MLIQELVYYLYNKQLVYLYIYILSYIFEYFVYINLFDNEDKYLKSLRISLLIKSLTTLSSITLSTYIYMFVCVLFLCIASLSFKDINVFVRILPRQRKYMMFYLKKTHHLYCYLKEVEIS